MRLRRGTELQVHLRGCARALGLGSHGGIHGQYSGGHPCLVPLIVPAHLYNVYTTFIRPGFTSGLDVVWMVYECCEGIGSGYSRS